MIKKLALIVGLCAVCFLLGMHAGRNQPVETQKDHAERLKVFGYYGRVVENNGDTHCIVVNIAGLRMRVLKGAIEPEIGDHFVLIAQPRGVMLGFSFPRELVKQSSIHQTD